MLEGPCLTLQEAADELGVHYMTAYRYVRLGLMDADKIGGTWEVMPDAVAAFRAGSVRSPVAVGERAPWSERLESRLVAGDADHRSDRASVRTSWTSPRDRDHCRSGGREPHVAVGDAQRSVAA